MVGPERNPEEEFSTKTGASEREIDQAAGETCREWVEAGKRT